jgi:ubiquitin-conjugating enzyme E2 J1
MAPSTTVRRLLRETLELSASSSNPNPSFHARPVSDEDLLEWHFTLLGPPSPSPYAGGLYHGRISLPLTYPLKPPNFRFLTPSGRFEVNREICLSISGFHEESWMPAWGIRTALVALRTFMGEEGTAGQVGGMEASKEVRQRMAQSSRQWKCEGCGGKTNEEAMREWWEICREKGIKVEEEAGVEELPEGLKLGFKDQLGNNDKKAADEAGTATAIASNTSTKANGVIPLKSAESVPIAVEGIAPRPEVSRSEHPSDPSSRTTNENGTSAKAGSSSAAPHSADHQTSTQHVMAPSPEERSTTNSSMTATAAAQQPPVTTPILDKAISGLVLALLFMVLKKVLYNPNVIAYDY